MHFKLVTSKTCYFIFLSSKLNLWLLCKCKSKLYYYKFYQTEKPSWAVCIYGPEWHGLHWLHYSIKNGTFRYFHCTKLALVVSIHSENFWLVSVYSCMIANLWYKKKAWNIKKLAESVVVFIFFFNP